jgi:hypothetical protein
VYLWLLEKFFTINSHTINQKFKTFPIDRQMLILGHGLNCLLIKKIADREQARYPPSPPKKKFQIIKGSFATAHRQSPVVGAAVRLEVPGPVAVAEVEGSSIGAASL